MGNVAKAASKWFWIWISKFDERFTKNLNEERDEGYFLEVDVKHTKILHSFHDDLLFLPERMKI